MEENQRFAIWKVVGTDILKGAEVEKILSNNRVELAGPNKVKTVIYWDFLCSIREGEAIIRQYHSIMEDYRLRIQALADERKRLINALIPIHENAT